MHIKTKRYNKTLFVLLLTVTFLNTRAENSIASDAIAFVFSIFHNRSKKERIRRNRLAPKYVQNNAIKIYKEMNALCKKHPSIGQFVINFDKPSKCPQIYHNIDLRNQQLGYSEPPGDTIYISSDLTKANFINSLEEVVIAQEIAHCVLGHNNRLSGHIIGLTRGEDQIEFEAETLTAFYLLKENKFETFKKYISQRKNLVHRLGQMNGFAAFKKVFSNRQLPNNIIELINAASARKIIDNIQFTNSYKAAKRIIKLARKLYAH